ncbi:astacin-like metalloendopeptidase isoform X3 [Hemitrygon akajei]|uniref:astacin-like metalloendopeptidase isoform X3 n=1 Tax=Hemitrygon akajei TaxID=2704970 RepID=UPI003BF97D73
MDSSCGMWRLLWFSLALVQEGQSEVKGPDSKSQLVATQTKTVLPEGAIVRMNQSMFLTFLVFISVWTGFSSTWNACEELLHRRRYYQTSPAKHRNVPNPNVAEIPRRRGEDSVRDLAAVWCSASVGRVGGTQLISLNRRCLEKGKGVIEHELMHSLGFWHEHTRSDRDKYIKIEWKNVWPGYEHNFLKKNTNNLKSGYDYGSILHYSRTAFSRNGQPTLTPLVDTDAVIGQRVRLSEMDLLKVNRLYNCTAYLEDKADTVKCKGKRNQWL